MYSRILSIITIIIFAVIALSGCAAKNNNPGVTGTTGMPGTSGGTTGTGTAAPTGALPGNPNVPGTSERPRPTERGDTNDCQIKKEVLEELANAGLSGSQIEVNVDDGMVTLKGTITTPDQAERARNIAWSVPNVTDVTSQLQHDNQ
jgi:hypothetical protein